MVERWIKQKAMVISDCASLMSGGWHTISLYDDVHVLDANNGHTWMTILGCVYNLTAILSATQECSLNKTTFHGVRRDSEPNLCWNGFHIEICQQGALQGTPKVPSKKIQIIFLAMHDKCICACTEKEPCISKEINKSEWLTVDSKVKFKRGLWRALSFLGFGHGSLFWRRPRCRRVGYPCRWDYMSKTWAHCEWNGVHRSGMR